MNAFEQAVVEAARITRRRRLRNRRRGGMGPSIVMLTMTGLTGGEARPGDHGNISVAFPTGVTAWTSQAWGVGAFGDDTYGTGANPTDYTASDGQTLRWEGAGDDGNTYRASAPIRYAPGSATGGSLADWVIGVTNVNLNFTSSFTTTNLTGTYVITGLPSGVVDDGDGTVSGMPMATPEALNITVTFTDQYNRPIVAQFTGQTVLPAEGSFAALDNQSFADDSGDQTYQFAAATGAGLSWTYAAGSLPAGVTYNAGTRTFTFDTNALAVQSGTSLSVSATDQHGRAAAGSPRSFTLEITAASTAQLTSVDLQAQPSVGADAPVALVGDEGTYPFVLVTTDPGVSAPTRQQVIDGQDHTGAAAPGSGEVTLTIGTPVNVDTGTLDGTFYLVVADSDSVLFDATPQEIAPAPVSPGTWDITDNGDGTGLTITSSPTPSASPAWNITDNGDGTGLTIVAHPTEA